MNKNRTKNCLSPAQVAVYLGICMGLCYRLLREGTIPSVRLGHRLIIPITALEAMLNAQTEGRDAAWGEESCVQPTATAPSSTVRTDDGEPPSG